MFKDLQAFYAARNEPENMRPLAEVYWRALLTLGLLMVVGVLMYGTWEFFGVIANLSSADATTAPSSATLDRNQLQNMLDSLNARQKGFDALPGVTASDPSK